MDAPQPASAAMPPIVYVPTTDDADRTQRRIDLLLVDVDPGFAGFGSAVGGWFE